MSKENLSYEDLIQIVQLVESSSRFAEFRLKSGDIEIELRAKADGVPSQGATAAPAAPPAGIAAPAPAAAPAGPSPATQQSWAAGMVLIRSPMVGTFYRAPEPGAQPFVAVGTRVEPDNTVCIIEVMKLMSSIAAEYSGVVTQILVDDARLVEAGQVLMVIDPKA